MRSFNFFFAHSRENATPYYNLLDILKLDNIFKLKVALFAHKIINNPAGIPTIFSGTLPLASDFHSHYTRFVSNLNFRRPLIHNNYGASTFTFIASKIWETIPLHLKKTILLPLFQTIQAISAKFAICFLEYIDLVYFSFFVLLFHLIHVSTYTCLL